MKVKDLIKDLIDMPMEADIVFIDHENSWCGIEDVHHNKVQERVEISETEIR